MLVISPEAVSCSIHDAARIAAVERLGLVGTPSEEAFDRLARLATRLLGTPGALVNIVTDSVQFCKSAIGLPEPWATEGLPLNYGVCPYTVASGATLLVENAATDPRFRDNPGVRALGVAGYAGTPLRASSGHVIGAFCAFDTRPRAWTEDEARILEDLAGAAMTEIELRATERRLREERETMETIGQVGRLLSAELDLSRLVQAVTEAATHLTHAQFGAFFYNVADEAGERYTLYTLAGAPREAFHTFPMPRKTAIFGPTFRGDGVIRLDDVRADVRFGQNDPFFGLPAGHLPVVSYLAAPVIGRNDEVLGALFFGHSEPGVFDERAEQLVVGLAAHAAIAVDNARLYEQAQAELSKRRRAEDDKQAFLDTVAHDLRNPLGAAKAQAQLIRRRVHRGDLDPESITGGLQTVESAINRAARMIAELHDVAYLESGRPLDLVRRPVDLVALTRSVADEQQSAASGHTIRLELPANSLWCSGDADRLHRVFTNVLANAIKFSPDGGDVVIELRSEADERAVLSVRDQGVGIPSRDLPRLFERYHRAGNVAGRIAGTGIGLWGSKHIIDQHGGSIAVESAESHGTTVTITLPLTA